MNEVCWLVVDGRMIAINNQQALFVVGLKLLYCCEGRR